MSNSACDEIAERLVDILGPTQIFRLYANNYRGILNEKLRPVSNHTDQGYQLPSLKYLYQYRVLISTLNTAGCLTRARSADNEFSSTHFSHIFIDEAASVQMAVALVGIAGEPFSISSAYLCSLSSNSSWFSLASSLVLYLGLCTDKSKINSKIILSGDSQQLEAVVMSRTAENMGYGKSIIEYLIEHPLYNLQNSPSNRVTQLKMNYRSHHKILEMPSFLFYHNSLLAVGPWGLCG